MDVRYGLVYTLHLIHISLTHEAAQGSESGILILKKDIKAQQFVFFTGTQRATHVCPRFYSGIKVNEQSWYQSKGQTCDT